VLSIAAFLVFGTASLVHPRMVAEFERYGLARFRRLVGSLEVAGALGLLVGYAVPALVLPAAAGLTLLMALGVGVRMRIRDTLLATLPAFGLMLVNGFLVVHVLRAASPAS